LFCGFGLGQKYQGGQSVGFNNKFARIKRVSRKSKGLQADVEHLICTTSFGRSFADISNDNRLLDT